MCVCVDWGGLLYKEACLCLNAVFYTGKDSVCVHMHELGRTSFRNKGLFDFSLCFKFVRIVLLFFRGRLCEDYMALFLS